MKITKLLTLIVLAVVAVGCGGLSPTSPTASAPSDEATAVVGTLAMDTPLPGCRYITDVRMRIVGDNPTKIRIEARYFAYGTPAACSRPPVWTARPNGRLIATNDPFVVVAIRTNPATNVEVSAEAPNGVMAKLVVK